MENLGADPKAVIGFLGSRYTLEEHTTMSALANRFHLGGYVGKHCVLGGKFPFLHEIPKRIHNGFGIFHIVFHRIDPEARVSAAVGNPLANRRDDSADVVRGVVGLAAV